MRIENEAIEKLKREVDLVELASSYGVQLKKRGRNWVGLCPFHAEERPSFTVNPSANLYICFGCPKGDNGGNAITFVMKKEGVGFREAYELLLRRTSSSVGAAPKRTKATASPESPSAGLDDPRSRARRQKLLDRVAAYYRRRFVEKPAGREYLVQRGIEDAATLEAYGVGLCDGTLHEIAPRDEAVTADLTALGILTETGRELFDGCVVFPLLDEQRSTVGMYGRRLVDGEVNHLYLPGPRRGLANRCGLGGAVVLCESVIDALSLSAHGVCALGCYGVQGFTREHLALLTSERVSEVVVCFDGDAAGREGAAAVLGQLRDKGKTARAVELPEGRDINELLVSEGIDSLRERLGAKRESGAGAAVVGAASYEPTKQGFVLRREGRLYEVKCISRQGTQLRATVKATRGDGQFELSSVDLYSHRSRAYFAALCAQLLGTDDSRTRDDLNEVLMRAESTLAQKDEAEQGVTIELTDTERAEAEALLTSPTMIDDIVADLERVGYTGERTNKLVGYLAAVSRKCEDPLSVLIQSRSGAGKSALQDAILSLVPEEDALAYSRLTDQALFYQKEDALVHKLLAIEEAEGMGGAAYSVRAMQSAKKLRVAATGKDPATGKMRTDEYTVRGPVAVMLTTTRTDFDQETLSRFLCVTVDESQEMTRRIHERQRWADTREGILARRSAERVQRRHHNMQRLLEPLVVENPYANELSFPVASLKTRRGNKKYLGLIKAITFLRQRQRKVEEIEHEGEKLRCVQATLDDIALANELTLEVLRHSEGDLTPQGARLREVIRGMVRQKSNETVKRWFTRRELREYSHWSDWQLKTHLGELVELEYLGVRQGERGKEYVYVVIEEVGGGDEAVLGLTPTAELIARLSRPRGGERRSRGANLNAAS